MERAPPTHKEIRSWTVPRPCSLSPAASRARPALGEATLILIDYQNEYLDGYRWP